MRTHRTIGVALAGLLASGCYASRVVRGSEVARVKGPLDDGVALPAERGPHARFDPGSLVRIRRKDGSVTRWFAARNLLTSADGVLVSSSWEPISSIRRAWVSNLPDEDAVLVRLTAPPGSHVKDHGAQLELIPPPEGFHAWLATFSEARALRRGEPPPDEQWQFATRGTLIGVSGASLASALDTGVPRVDGLRWDDVASVEVRNFDGLATFFTVVSAPAWLTAIVLIGRVGAGPLISVVFDEARAPSPTSRAPGAEEVSDDGIHQGNVLTTGSFAPPDPRAAQPVFSPEAKRRSRMRPLVWLGAGAQLSDAASSNASVGIAARLSDVVEVGGGFGTWWPDIDGPAPYRPGGPLAPGPPRWVPYFNGFVRVGSDFPADADRRVSLPLLLEVASGGSAFFQFRFRYGVRLRFAGEAFIGLHPFNAYYTEQRVPGLASWTFPSTMELGWTF